MNIKKVLVIGAGTMGSGIAQWFAQQGVQTELSDNNPVQSKQAYDKILTSWKSLCEKKKFTEAEKKHFESNLKTTDLKNSDKEADLVIEAIIENCGIKKNLFLELDKMFSEKTILSSNTSSFLMELLAEDLPENRKKRFLGLHFFNPAPIMKLVEIIESKWTDKRLSQELYEWFDKQGKKPALCQDSPGFIVNRVARNFYGEALRIVEKNDKEKIKEVDEVMRKVAGFRMGPFELMDLIGIDVNYSVTQSVWEAYKKTPRFAPHPLQKMMTESGKIGRKSGEGFYQYE